MEANQQALEENQEAIEEQKEEFLALQEQAEAEVKHLQEVEQQRLEDERIREALEARRREEQRQRELEAEQQRQQAAAEAAEARGRHSRPRAGRAGTGAGPGRWGRPPDRRRLTRRRGRRRGTDPAPGRARARPEPEPEPSPPPSGGMVCPVAGASSYSDTYGAARSGGRSHEGVDMLAPSGTPLVAVVSGSVEFGSSPLGGNSLWLHGSDGNAYFYAHLSSFEGSSAASPRAR